jgi:hypothetical protein
MAAEVLVPIRSVPIDAISPSDGVAAVGGTCGFQRRLSGVPGQYPTGVAFYRNGLALVEMNLGSPAEALRLVDECISGLDRDLRPDEHRLHRSAPHGAVHAGRRAFQGDAGQGEVGQPQPLAQAPAQQLAVGVEHRGLAAPPQRGGVLADRA